MRISGIVAVTALGSILAACTPSDEDGEQDQAQEVEAPTADVAEADAEGRIEAELVTNSSGPLDVGGDVTELRDLEVISGIDRYWLHFTVDYSGGSTPHTYQVYWDGMTLESSPPQVNFTLVDNRNGDEGKALTSQEVRLDLSELAEVERPYTINLSANGAETQSIQADY